MMKVVDIVKAENGTAVSTWGAATRTLVTFHAFYGSFFAHYVTNIGFASGVPMPPLSVHRPICILSHLPLVQRKVTQQEEHQEETVLGSVERSLTAAWECK